LTPEDEVASDRNWGRTENFNPLLLPKQWGDIALKDMYVRRIFQMDDIK